MHDPGPAVRVGSQVALKRTFRRAPGQGPGWRPRRIPNGTLAFELLMVDRLHLLLDEHIQLGEQLGQRLAVILDPSLEQEVAFAHRHAAHHNRPGRLARIAWRRTSATLHAWAMQPTGRKGDSGSKISLILPSPASDRWAMKGCSRPRTACASPLRRRCASQYGPSSHGHTI